uniref:Uncharacterized protein n=1 Tax=Pipistrellus kuhlii TaxID=59472 RepID=A0A7J7QW27_PIPKU|nr:hypothetical protein mPipKuh1_008238 [Pipistrellus kuhlii]
MGVDGSVSQPLATSNSPIHSFLILPRCPARSTVHPLVKPSCPKPQSPTSVSLSQPTRPSHSWDCKRLISLSPLSIRRMCPLKPKRLKEAWLAWQQAAEPAPPPPLEVTLSKKVRLQSPSLAGQGCWTLLKLNQNNQCLTSYPTIPVPGFHYSFPSFSLPLSLQYNLNHSSVTSYW